MMTPEQHGRFEFLMGRWCPFDFVRDYYGIDFAARDSVCREFAFWMTQRKGEPFRDASLDRYWLETFLQSQRLTSRRWMAARLGMKHHSLDETLVAIERAGPVLRYHTSEQVIGTRFEDDLWNLFPEIRNSTPSEHNSLCRRLHAQVEQSFGVRIDPEWCATSVIVGDRQYARHIDPIALEPVCVRYQVWLDLGKWMTLAPDLCSAKTYVENESVLDRFLAGEEPPEVIKAIRDRLLAGAA